jgi:hypothetical protein
MARQLTAGFSAPAHQSSSPAMDAFRSRAIQGPTPNMRDDGYSEPRTTTMVMPSSDVGSSAGLYSRSLKAAAYKHLLGGSRSTVVEDSHSDTLIARTASLITRKANGTLPAFRDQVASVIAEDAKDAVEDAQRTRAYRSQAYAKTFPGVETMASDSVLRDASNRMVGSKSSVHIYRYTTPGQGGKSFKDLCRDIAINKSGYMPKNGDEQGWIGIHKGYSIEPIGYDSVHSRNNDDDVFQGATKIYNRGDNRYGYDNDDSDADAEYVANRKGRNPEVATGERDSIYSEGIEEAIEELAVDAAEYIFNLALDEGYDENDAADFALEHLDDFVESYYTHWTDEELDEIASIEEMTLRQAKDHADEKACHFWDCMLTHEYEPKPGKKRYGVIPLSHYNMLPYKDHFKLKSVHHPVKECVDIDEGEESEFQGRKLRQNLSKKERKSLERHGSLAFKSAGATRVRKSHDGTVKESVEDHVNALKAAGQDRDKFQAAYNDASKLKHADLAKVASGYHLGPEKMYKTKGHALKSLEAAFIRNARFENKLKKEDTQADRMNHMQGLDPQAHNRLSDTIRATLGQSWTDDKLWTDGQFKYTGEFRNSE